MISKKSYLATLVTLLMVAVIYLAYTAKNGGGNSDNRTITLSTSSADDATYALLCALNEAKECGATNIEFERGTYHFYASKAREKFVHISNHDDVLTRIAFELESFNDLTINGNDSKFIFHGRIIPFLITDCNNVKVENLTIDWLHTFHSECTVVANNPKERTFDIEIPQEYNYEIRDNQLVFLTPDYEFTIGESILFDPETEGVAYTTEFYTPITTQRKIASRGEPFDYKYKTDPNSEYLIKRGKENQTSAKELRKGLVRIYGHRKQIPPVGLVLMCKGKFGQNRIAPAFKLNNVTDFEMEEVTVNHAGGMAFLAENCENLLLDKFNVLPADGRLLSTTADATHFVGCRGKVTLHDCELRNQLDDAMNVHGTYQEVVDILGTNTIGVRMGHFQQLAFRIAREGDTIGLVRLADSFSDYEKLTVKSIELINGRYQRITFNEELPTKLRAGDLIENISAYPEVEVSGCTIAGNRARGLLISTPRSTLVKDNYFATEMEALLLPVESSSWFESGNAANVTIEGNTFENCNISGFDRGVIRFVTDDKNANIAFNNITIKGNTFNHFDNWILEISNVDGLTFEQNKVRNSGAYRPLYPERPVITVANSQNITIDNNDIESHATEFVHKGEGCRAVSIN